MVSHIHFPGIREFVFVGSGKSYHIVFSYRFGLRSGLLLPIGKRGFDGLSLPEVLSSFFFVEMGRVSPRFSKDCN